MSETGKETLGRSMRDLRVEALSALLNNQIVAVAKRHDWPLLEEIARIVQEDAPVDLAFTDPSLYVALRNAVTRFHLVGWTRMSPERVRAVAWRYEELQRKRHAPPDSI